MRFHISLSKRGHWDNRAEALPWVLFDLGTMLSRHVATTDRVAATVKPCYRAGQRTTEARYMMLEVLIWQNPCLMFYHVAEIHIQAKAICDYQHAPWDQQTRCTPSRCLS